MSKGVIYLDLLDGFQDGFFEGLLNGLLDGLLDGFLEEKWYVFQTNNDTNYYPIFLVLLVV
jgi:hypothetical protein